MAAGNGIGASTTKSKAPFTPLKAAYKIVQILNRVPVQDRSFVIQNAAKEVGI